LKRKEDRPFFCISRSICILIKIGRPLTACLEGLFFVEEMARFRFTFGLLLSRIRA
jgi:hypothetical protein